MDLRLPKINELRIIGRLTRDVNLRYTAKGVPVAHFDIASNYSYKDAASGEWKDISNYISVVAWNELSERCSEKLKKGFPVYVEGRIQSRNWESKDGVKRSTIELIASKIQFLFSNSGSDFYDENSVNHSSSQSSSNAVGKEEENNEIDVPF